MTIASGETEHGHAIAHSIPVPPPLVASRDAEGRLVVQSGAVQVLADASFEWSGWEGVRGVMRLSTGGYIANSLTLEMPPGVGWRHPGERRLRSRFLMEGDIPLDDQLHPSRNATGLIAGGAEFLSETYPVVFTGDAWRWAEGVFSLVSPATEFIRRDYYDQWRLEKGDIPDSNDGFWFLLRAVAGANLEIRPGLEGGISTELRFGPGGFFSHFPRGALRASGGVMRISDSQVVPGESRLENALAFVLYGKGCRDPGEVGGVPSPLQGVQLDGVVLEFTPSAGLRASGELTPTSVDPVVERHLEIGRNGSVPTHGTDEFTRASFYMPGPWIPSADGFDSLEAPNGVIDEAGEAPLVFNPARHLLTGIDPGTLDPEYPGTPAYLDGAGDYAGMNFRDPDSIHAESTVAGMTTDPYPLAGRSKYYVRQSGVSGIHQSSEGPGQLPAYGYDIELASFGLSFLSNQPHDSRIAGTISLPHPSELTQEFDQLLMNCCGNLTEGRIAPGDEQKQLAYWSETRLGVGSLRFTHDPADPCDTGNGLLELGVIADVAHLDVAPSGFLYPRPDGTLVATDSLERESHLVIPADATLAGYPFTAVRHAYFNDYSEFTEGPGWINLAGTAGVSFFRDLEVHAHVLGSSGVIDPPIFIKAGWSEGGHGYFDTAGFDEPIGAIRRGSHPWSTRRVRHTFRARSRSGWTQRRSIIPFSTTP